ncbi:MAG: hypothetical protein QOK43_720 [Acidimicrobiaceae bacterium]|nr:hypothetical protein [Acidimicrobiaceae bacterium]
MLIQNERHAEHETEHETEREAKTEGKRQGGYTMVEVVVVCGILLGVLAMFFSILEVLTKHERRTQALVSNEQNVRFFLQEMARDIRSANPMQRLVTATAADYTNSLELALGPSAGPQTYVRWVYDPATQIITRKELTGPGGAIVRTTAKLTRVRNNESGTPFLRYYNQHNQDLVGLAIPDDVANCAIRVHVTVISDSNPGPQPFTENVDVELRNRLPGGIGCG